ncbi:hypothetical protein [uncultured Sphingomonas sp.]|uniref:hypothetical protein n=1 Tax=uncultured Sphingomonas sp. TaxID=158754 RepID=UPI00262DD19F|nr:hypothetical protein [uncultured Sphingomonas sp.]
MGVTTLALLLCQSASAQQADRVTPNLLAPLFACLDQAAQPRAICLNEEARKLRETQQRRGVVLLDRDKAAAMQASIQHNEDANREKGRHEALAAFSPIAAPLTAARQQNGLWLFDVQGHGTWKQAESGELGRDPRPGDLIRIRRGTIGGFLLNIRTGPAIRVKPIS